MDRPIEYNYISHVAYTRILEAYCDTLEQPEQVDCPRCGHVCSQRPWVGLTDEEIEKACVPLGAAMLSFTEVARAIEAKLKERNV
jgi:hypothetical protein